MKHKIVSLLIIVGLAAGIGAGILERAAAQAPDVVVIGKTVDVTTLDPQKNTVTSTEMVLVNLYDTLIVRDAELRLKPGLALSWQAVEPTTWELKLRRGVRFHNGEPFNAHAVKFSFERGLDPKTKWTRVGEFRLIKSVTVVDDYTLRITTERPWALFLQAIARHGWIVPRRYLEQNGEEALVRRPVGTGPYKFVRWVKDDRLELEANTTYWGGGPKIGRVIIRVIPSELTRLAELMAGSVHVIDQVPPELFGPIERSTRGKLVNGPSLLVFMMLFNLVNIPRDRPLADKRVRQAINHAIDRPALIESIMRNTGSPLATFCPPNSIGCDTSIPPFPYDPERARALVREAGHPSGFDMAFSGTNGAYLADNDTTLAVADQLSRVGIRTRVIVKERGVWLRELLDKKVPEDALYVPSQGFLGWSGDPAMQLFHSRGIGSLWNNREFDQLLDTAAATLDEARAKELLRRAQLLYKDEAPGIPLYNAPNVAGLHRDLEWTPRGDQLLTMLDATWKRR